MKIQNVKGGYDYLPKDQNIRNYINDILRKNFEKYGYKSIETPILCYYDMLSDKYDEDSDILKEIYKLTDQGNRKLGLRYDLTVPFAKFIALNKNKLSFPFKRYEISKVFRDGPIKQGRDREFTQCDVDVVGLQGQFIEGELLSLFVQVFKELEIEIVIKYNSRSLMNGLLLESGVNDNLISQVTTLIDKKAKISKEEFYENFKILGLNSKVIDSILKYFDMSLEELTNTFIDTNNESIRIGLSEINSLKEYIEFLKIDNMCIFDSSLARGQNYYTGNVFEVYEKNNKISGSIGAGGRYDKMITDFIKDGNLYPTVGISFGLSSIYELLKNTSRFDDISKTKFYIIPMDTEKESLRLANELRSLGYNVQIEMRKRKLKKSLEYADKEKIPYVIILGNEELKNNKIEIKDMLNNGTFTIELDNIEILKNKIL